MDSITFCWLKEFSSITLNRQKGEISFAQYVATKVQKKGKKKKRNYSHNIPNYQKTASKDSPPTPAQNQTVGKTNLQG